jgi:hypothetical protein
MRKVISQLLGFALMLGIGLIPAKAQTSGAIAESNPAVYSLAEGAGNIMPDPGRAGPRGCSSSGSRMGSIPGEAATGYSLSQMGPRTLSEAGRKGAPKVPELASMILFGSGLMLLGGALRRRNARPAQARQNALWVTKPFREESAIPASMAAAVRND